MAKQVVQLEKCQKESETQLEALISEQNENFEVMTNKLDQLKSSELAKRKKMYQENMNLKNEMRQISDDRDKIKKQLDGLELVTKEFKEECKVKENDSKQ